MVRWWRSNGDLCVRPVELPPCLLGLLMAHSFGCSAPARVAEKCEHPKSGNIRMHVGPRQVVKSTPFCKACRLMKALSFAVVIWSCANAVQGDSISDRESSGGFTTSSLSSLPYPARSTYRIKALQPDFWSNPDDIVGNNAGGVAVNLVWDVWEPRLQTPPCAANQEAFDGHCFQVDAAVSAAVKTYSQRGLVVTGIVYGTPGWARIANCSPAATGFERFCVPRDMADFGRFMRYVARRFNRESVEGRVADFVVWNEVNANDWFDIGCGQGTSCNSQTWIQSYASMYNSAFDNVRLEQENAKVLMSFEHHFASSFDLPSAKNPLLGVQTMLLGLAPLVAPRAWRVAYHPYPPDLLKPAFSADDWPKVTYGNIGVLAGWLRATFPTVPSAFEIQLTESGVNSLSPNSSPDAQARSLCDSFRNVLGTPGIENYVYHRMVDNPDETKAGLGLGLTNSARQFKPAWSTWALANRSDLNPPQLSCGFERLPFTQLTRSYSASRGHWASSRLAPAGFRSEATWRLSRDSRPNSSMLYECQVGAHNLVSTDPRCEGLRTLGPVGYASQSPSGAPIYRCRVGQGSDHFISADPGCEGQTVESLLGYGW